MTQTLEYDIKDPLELNLSYMPFIKDGGLFVPTAEHFELGDLVNVNLMLPGKKSSLPIEGKVVWLTPPNALHHVLQGIGIQFTGSTAANIQSQIEAWLDTSIEVGGYTYGMIDETNKEK